MKRGMAWILLSALSALGVSEYDCSLLEHPYPQLQGAVALAMGCPSRRSFSTSAQDSLIPPGDGYAS